MNINELAKSIGKDADGHLSHPGLHFPSDDDAHLPQAAIPTASVPPRWTSYTTEQISLLTGVKKSNLWSMLIRRRITCVSYRRRNLWRKEEVDKILPSLSSKIDTIPQGYIDIDKAIKLAGVSKSAILRNIKKYNMRTAKAKILRGSVIRVTRLVHRRDLLASLPCIQQHIRQQLLTKSCES